MDNEHLACGEQPHIYQKIKKLDQKINNHTKRINNLSKENNELRKKLHVAVKKMDNKIARCVHIIENYQYIQKGVIYGLSIIGCAGTLLAIYKKLNKN